MGVKLVRVQLAPHGSVVALQPLLSGVGPYRIGIIFSPQEPIKPNPILRRLNEMLLRFAPKLASAKYLLPQDEVTLWCPSVISQPSKDLPEAVAPNFNDVN